MLRCCGTMQLQHLSRRINFSVAAFALSLAGCQRGVLAPEGPVGASERIILLDAVGIMLAVVVPTIGAAAAFAWWFRASNARARYLPNWSYSGRLELLVWSIPVLVVLFLGAIGWVSSHDLDPLKALPARERPLEVQVVSLDWKWLFIYPNQNVAAVNQLVIPTGLPVHFSLTSATVMNSFFVPRLGSQIYTMAGMRTQLNLQADRPGVYHGISAQFSGDGFADMTFHVHAVSMDEFGEWVRRTRGGDAPTLDAGAYGALAKQSKAVTPSAYSAVAAGLFEEVVGMHLPNGVAPRVGQTATPISPRAEN